MTKDFRVKLDNMHKKNKGLIGYKLNKNESGKNEKISLFNEVANTEKNHNVVIGSSGEGKSQHYDEKGKRVY
ncbi:hypothetical protein QLG35_10925 [Staphylococcus aureus]|uniref:hypothetical protein n=1 Tax=Staphylococcus aureus TaxID=1280 RepID=UPI00289154EE|nr:hypothetical protein [Staphylococcus aureus]MDT3056717.1 hypothetical protein [Staphylococcus aureus]